MNESQQPAGAAGSQSSFDLRALFHRLNNQLGILLAQAELLEAKADDDAHRARAAQIVSSALAAMAIVRDIQQQTESGASQ